MPYPLAAAHGGKVLQPSVPWYLAGGVPILAYQPKGAASLAASYVNLANPGTYDAAPGTAPAFATETGWTFGSNRYLTTGVTPGQNWSMLVQFLESADTNGGIVAGSLNGSNRFWIWPANTDTSHNWGHGGDLSVDGRLRAGVAVLSGPTAYLNGQVEGTISAGSYTFAPIFIGCVNLTGPSYYFGDIVERVALYDRVLTPTEVTALYNAVGKTAVMFGDSITAGVGATDYAHRWTTLVANARGYTSNTQGIAGSVLQNTAQTTSDVIGGAVINNGRDTHAARVIQQKPTYVYILYGLNDLRLNDAAFSDTQFGNDLGEVVDGIVADGVLADNIVIGSPPYIPESSYATFAPWNGGSRVKHAAYTAACAAVATAKGTRYANVYQYMTDHGGDTLVSGDTIHPNDAGHAAIAAAFLAEL